MSVAVPVANVCPSTTTQTDGRYAGWIITDASGFKCRKRLFDNRTGYLWDQGYVKCNDAFDPEEPDSSRFHNIGKAFRHE